MAAASPADSATHWGDCWRFHLPCAIARINRLAEVVRIQRQALRKIAEGPDAWSSPLAKKALQEGRNGL